MRNLLRHCTLYRPRISVPCHHLDWIFACMVQQSDSQLPAKSAFVLLFRDSTLIEANISQSALPHGTVLTCARSCAGTCPRAHIARLHTRVVKHRSIHVLPPAWCTQAYTACICTRAHTLYLYKTWKRLALNQLAALHPCINQLAAAKFSLS